MRDFIIGKILENSIKEGWGKTYFYVLNGKDKVLIILQEGVSLPDDLEGSFEFRGTFGYSIKNKVMKLHTTSIKQLKPEIDYREELRQMVEKMRSQAI